MHGFPSCLGKNHPGFPSCSGENHLDPKSGQEVDPDKPGCTMCTSCQGIKPTQHFPALFSGYWSLTTRAALIWDGHQFGTLFTFTDNKLFV